MSSASDSSESQLFQQVTTRLYEKAEKVGIHNLSEVERVFHVVSCVSTGIASEVIYAVFHEMPELLPYASDAYFDVGLPGDAANFAAMLELLPAPAEDKDERLNQVIAIQDEDPDLDDKIQHLDSQFDSDRAYEALREFFQKHRAELLA